VILIAGPDPGSAARKAQPLPTKDRVLAIVDEVGKRKIDPWEDKAVTAKLLAQPPKPGTITKETKRDAIKVTEWTLSNGVRVIVKPTDFEADQVALLGSSPGGLAMASDRD
jgi:zinc protease